MSRVFFQILGVMFATSACILFKQEACYLFLYGLILGNSLLVLKVIAANGVGTFIGAAIEQVVTGGETEIPIMRQLEVHDVTFAIGAYMLFLLIQHRWIKHVKFKLLISAALFGIGFKRIAILSITMLVVVFIVLRTVRPLSKFIMGAAAAALMCGSMCYVIIIKDGIFDYLVDKFEINTMGRAGLYDMFKDKFDMSIGFIGHGAGWTTRLITQWFEDGVIDHSFGALHNDILTMYLELGFVGFLIWLVVELYVKNRIIGIIYGERMEIITFIVGLYVFITYFSDNTHFYPCVQTSLYLIPMGYAFERRERFEKSKHKKKLS